MTERVTQAFYTDGKDNLVERTYIWNTTHFTLVNAIFVTGADGSHWIENLQIRPENENFDFEGGWVSETASTVLGIEARVDPWSIGQPVGINYVGQPFNYDTYTATQFATDKQFFADSYAPVSNFFEAISSTLLQDLFNAGVTRFIDAEGRAIALGGVGDDILSSTGFALRAPLLADAAIEHGIHFVGGSGADVLTGGFMNDFFEGGRDGDTIDGGAGTDTATYERSQSGVKIDLIDNTASGGDAEGDTLSNIENLIGTKFNDTLVGNDEANVLTGLDGRNVLVGGMHLPTVTANDNHTRRWKAA